MRKLVECVPNFSEGCNQHILAEIAQAISAVPGTKLLNYSADQDHNRSVYTLVGEPEAVIESMVQAAKYALKYLDLTKHQGVHPRIGAIDVIPFIPYQNMTMDEAVTVAQLLGKRYGEELEIPVYLYENAATCPEHRNLAAVRRGGFEGLAKKMQDPVWQPDYGPCRMHPTFGAVVIGARYFLIAYNVNLKSNNLELAKAIAKKIRTADGGLPYVKALGLYLSERDIVQVSCNLTDFRVTPIHTVFEAIKREAADNGVEVLESEIIGLPPMQAMIDCAAHYLRLPSFNRDDVLEGKLL